jgi:flagellar secretion chaperone FliS
MFGSAKNGAHAYGRVGIETGVGAASPHALIVMLFEGVLVALADAERHMAAKNIPGKGQSISKALQIIDEGLKASLDERSGGEIAMRLKDLYDYMSSRLLLASLRNEPGPILEVRNLLSQLKDAWEAIGEKSAPPASQNSSISSGTDGRA